MKNNKVIILSAAAVFVAGFLLFSLEKLQVINVYSKPISSTNNDAPRPVNDVDYTPETSAPDGSINSEKNPSQSTNPTPSSTTTVTITRANQDATTKNLNIGVLVEGTNSGSCKLELLQNNVPMVTKTAAVTEQSGLVTCAGFTVLASEIPNSAMYSVKVSVGDASTSQSVELYR